MNMFDLIVIKLETARSPEILGIHHVTALCGDPQKNVNFYSGLLGLGLVNGRLTSMIRVHITSTTVTAPARRVPS